MEWKLADSAKVHYDKLFNNARELETNIGNAQYRLFRLCKMREEMDGHIKKWWDSIIEELNVPKDKDYMITPDGMIKEVPRQDGVQNLAPSAAQEASVPKSNVGSNASELK